MPKALGGQDDLHTNPEQLFAAGYAACFDSALNRVIKLAKAEAGETAVAAKVSIGQLDNGGFGLAVELAVTIPGVNAAQAQELVEQAHAICPYSNATRNNIDVQLTVNP
jgi:osmotically inducible protein OsmC